MQLRFCSSFVQPSAQYKKPVHWSVSTITHSNRISNILLDKYTQQLYAFQKNIRPQQITNINTEQISQAPFTQSCPWRREGLPRSMSRSKITPPPKKHKRKWAALFASKYNRLEVCWLNGHVCLLLAAPETLTIVDRSGSGQTTDRNWTDTDVAKFYFDSGGGLFKEPPAKLEWTWSNKFIDWMLLY